MGEKFRVDVQSEKYKKKREQQKEFLDDSDFSEPFGYVDLDVIDSIREEEQGADPKKPNDEIKKILASSRELLLGYLRDIYTLAFAKYILEEAIADSRFIAKIGEDSKLKGLFALASDTHNLSKRNKKKETTNKGNKIQVRTLWEALEEGFISNELYELMLRIHKENFEKKLEKFNQKLPEYLSNIRGRVESKINEGVLPITLEHFDHIVSETTFSIRDGLEASFEETNGKYLIDLGKIYIAEFLETDEAIEDTLTHELMHALGGRTILGTHTSVAGYKIEDFNHQRSGLFFGDKKNQKSWQLQWLNEALTETLTDLVIGKSRKNYANEKKLLNLLQSRGGHKIDMQAFINAYFENYSMSHPDRVPAWKELIHQINESYTPGFLLALDTYIKENSLLRDRRGSGVKKAIELLETDWRQI